MRRVFFETDYFIIALYEVRLSFCWLQQNDQILELYLISVFQLAPQGTRNTLQVAKFNF